MKDIWRCIRGGPLALLVVVLVLGVSIGPLADLLDRAQAASASPGMQQALLLRADELRQGMDQDGDADAGRDYKSCGECHLDYHAAWATGVHSIAYDRASFQAAWQEGGSDPECLTCHVTNFRPATGEYFAPNIQCEACHGLTPANHPPEPLRIDRSADMCGDCHDISFFQWERSAHAFTPDMGAVGCATCHNPHGQQIRLGDINTLCLNCHAQDVTSYVHLSHNEIEYEGVDVTCASCHMYQEFPDELHQLSDHTMYVGTVSCTDCHQQISLTGVSPLLVDLDTALAEERNQLRAEVQELETRLAATQARVSETRTADYVQLAQGIIIGLGVGIVLVWVLMRRGNDENIIEE